MIFHAKIDLYTFTQSRRLHQEAARLSLETRTTPQTLKRGVIREEEQ
jgi:hypothetical protein